jgi:hypothetical protein
MISTNLKINLIIKFNLEISQNFILHLFNKKFKIKKFL